MRSARFLASLLLPLALVPSAALGESIPISGRVIGPDGLPVAGARAWLLPPAEPAFASFPDDPQPAHPPAAIDAAGAFALTAPAAGSWRVVVEAPHHAPAAVDLPGLVAAVELPPLVPVRSEATVLRVTDAAGRPVPGARILTVPATAAPSAAPWVTAPEVRVADADGVAELAGVAAEVAIVAEGFAVARRRLEGSPAVTVLLPAGRPRQIRAVDADGRPAAGVRAAIEGIVWPAATGDDGRLEVKVETGRRVSLRLLAADGRWAAGHLEPASRADEPDALFRLRAPAAVGGQVADRATRQPLAGAWVWPTADPARGARSDGRGHFVLAVPFTPPVRLGAARQGYLPTQAAVAGAASSRVSSLLLSPAAEVGGRVEDERGRPLPGARLRLDLADRAAPPPGEASWARSQADGTFRFTGVDPAPTYWLRASWPGHADARLTVAGLRSGRPSAFFRVVLPRGRDARGVVLDAAEAPVAGAIVRCLPSSVTAEPDAWLTAGEALRSTATSGDGAFVLADLAPGKVDLYFEAAGFAPAWVRGVEPFSLDDDAAVDLGTFVLEPDAAVTGSVVDPDGTPIAGAVITVAERGPAALRRRDDGGAYAPLTATSDAEGVFTVRGLPSGVLVDLHAEHPDHVAGHGQATAGDGAEVVLVLKPASRLEGRVVDGDGEPVPGAVVLATVDGAESFRAGAVFAGRRTLSSARSDDEGRFVLHGVESARLRLEAVARGFLSAGMDLQVAEGEVVTDLELVLDAGAAITGTVRDADGLAVAGARVAVVVEAAGLASRLEPPEAVADADGHYRLSGLAAGPCRVRADHPDYVTAEAGVDVRPGGNVVDLRLGRGVEVAGLALDGDGEPVVGARVSLVADGGVRPADPVSSDGAGRFRFRAVPAGTYRLVGERAGYATARSAPVAVSATPPSALELRFERGAAIAGRLLGLDFEQVARAEVWASAPGLPGRRGIVLHDGSYRIDGLRPGEWRVTARAPGFPREATAKAVVEAGVEETFLDLELAADGFVLTGVVLRDGRPLPGALVASSGADGGTGGSVTDAAGLFRLTGLAAGPHQLTVLHPASGQTLTRRLDLEGDLQVRLELPAAESGERSPGSGGTSRRNHREP